MNVKPLKELPKPKPCDHLIAKCTVLNSNKAWNSLRWCRECRTYFWYGTGMDNTQRRFITL